MPKREGRVVFWEEAGRVEARSHDRRDMDDFILAVEYQNFVGSVCQSFNERYPSYTF
jgi:hypothetical protein